MIRIVVVLIVLAVSGFFAFKGFFVKPPPPPPIAEPPPPPPPLINPQEEERVLKSCRDPDPAVRWEAVKLLDNMKSPRANEIIFERLHKDEDLELRKNVVGLLRKKKGPDVAVNLVKALQDGACPSDLKMAILDAMTFVGDLSVAPAVTDTLKDTDETVRIQALRTLNELNKIREKKVEEIEAQRQKIIEQQKQQEAQKKR